MKQKTKQTVKLPKRQSLASKQLKDQYPNPGEIGTQQVVEIHENNHFKNMDPEEIRKRYLQFSVFMEQLNTTLQLDRTASVEQFARRVHDLVMAAAKV